ncbi:MAG: hypothetical protein HOE90_18770 [Bacteriovoracaceae bacterium]|jgi:hypothetical protein|nr:hypothetical protein [Bacteriovoracaceae bacterium]
MSNYQLILFLLVIPFLSSCFDESEVGGASFGTVTGTIIDAQTGAVVATADVSIAGYAKYNTIQSGITGSYTMSEAPIGNWVVNATKSGYTEGSANATVRLYTTTSNVDIPILKSEYAKNKVVIILTWGLNPTDLDSHLYVPAGPTVEINFGNLGNIGASPFAALDLDDLVSYGPETTAIAMSSGVGSFSGTYRFWVRNFSNNTSLTTSGASVRVYVNGSMDYQFDVPTTGSGRNWHVFDMNGSNLAFTTVNTLTDAAIAAP